jgi:putative transposase
LTIGEAHRRYSQRINFREKWLGHLWQGRFSSFILDERYLLACRGYVELNPVRAGLVKKPEDWSWSGARPHMNGKDDILVKTKPLIEIANESLEMFLDSDTHEQEIALLRKHERTGRSLGGDSFIESLECLLDRDIKPQKPGPKKKDK